MKRIVVDTSTGCLDYYKHDYDIRIIRIPLFFGEEKYYDGDDMKSDIFYKRIKSGEKNLPKTSQPSLGELLAFFEDLVEEGYEEAFVTTISSDLSGIYNGINVVKGLLEEKIKIYTYDTKTVCFSEGVFALKAAKLMKEGKTIEEIYEHLDFYKENNIILFGVSNLEFLIKNGRLSNAKGFIANMFQIKPLLKVSDGKINVLRKVRTTSSAFEALANEVKEYTKGHENYFIYYAYTGNDEVYNKLKDLLEERFPNNKFITVPGTPVVGTHVGVDAIGVGVFIDYDKSDV